LTLLFYVTVWGSQPAKTKIFDPNPRGFFFTGRRAPAEPSTALHERAMPGSPTGVPRIRGRAAAAAGVALILLYPILLVRRRAVPRAPLPGAVCGWPSVRARSRFLAFRGFADVAVLPDKQRHGLVRKHSMPTFTNFRTRRFLTPVPVQKQKKLQAGSAGGLLYDLELTQVSRCCRHARKRGLRASKHELDSVPPKLLYAPEFRKQAPDAPRLRSRRTGL
jgi:hypothetical protein